MRYSDLLEKLNLYITRKDEDNTLAYITHYLQNYGHAAADYFADEALHHLPNDLDIGNIIWDIPFPNVMDHKFTFVDLFAGIGGTRIAFENLGGKCVFSSEIDFFAKQSYQFNYGEVPFGDITQISEESVPDHDVLVGGFPCQAFSIAGKRGGFDDTRGTLFFEIARIIREKRPKAFFLENVKGLLSHDRGKTINVILNTLREDLGYFVPDPQIVSASDFGVPQKRDRVYIIGFRGDLDINEFEYPEPLDYETSFIDIKEKEVVSAKYYLSDVLLETLRNHRLRHASAGNGFGYEVIDDEGIANAIVTGGMGRERNLVVDKRLKDFTPVTKIKGEVNREGIRRMTPREWARLQGFPDKYEIKVSDAQAYKQFGNSVAVPAVQATGERVIKRLMSNETLITPDNYQDRQSLNINDSSLNSDHVIERKMATMTYNKGEWSEIYAALRLLADGGIYGADSNLDKIEGLFYPLIKILRKELSGKDEVNYEYRYGIGLDEHIQCNDDVDIYIVDGDTDQTLLQMSVGEFKDKSLKLLEDIKVGKGRSFPVSVEISNFLKSIYINRVSQKSSKKRDITIVVYDSVKGFTPTLGFSIKSMLGSSPTLLNATKATNFTYKVVGQALPLSDEEVDRINIKYSSTYERIVEIERLGYHLEFDGMDNETFKSNLQMLDTAFPFIISEFLQYYYKRECSPSMETMLGHIGNLNPCNYNTEKDHSFYRFKMQRFLEDAALGMVPDTVWQGIYDATGGYIIVKKDGELVCYHVYNRNEFQDYLVKYTRFDAGSRNKHNFGSLYKDNDNVYMKLNLQVRFR